MGKHAWQIALFFSAASLGATYLTGFEWLNFFAFYGTWGTIGAILVAIGLTWLTDVLMTIAHREGIASAADMLDFLFGPMYRSAITSFLSIFLLLYAGTIVAKQAHLLDQIISLPGLLAVVMTGVVSYLFLVLDRRHLFTILSITLVLGALLIAWLFTEGRYIPIPPLSYQLNTMWLWSALGYIALHFLFVLYVLVPLPHQEYTPGSIRLGIILGGLICLVLTLAGIFAILAYWHEAHASDSPLLLMLLQRSWFSGIPFVLATISQAGFLVAYIVQGLAQPLFDRLELRRGPVLLSLLSLVCLTAFLFGKSDIYVTYVLIASCILGYIVCIALLRKAKKSP